jgi:hypothetical protein
MASHTDSSYTQTSAQDPRLHETSIRNREPCMHSCEGARCNTHTHSCDIPNCTQQGKRINQHTLSGGGLRIHRKSVKQHPNCNSNCKGYRYITSNAKKRADKIGVERDSKGSDLGDNKEGDDEGDVDEERLQYGGFQYKRRRIISSTDEERSERDGIYTQPTQYLSPTASDLGATMGVDLPIHTANDAALRTNHVFRLLVLLDPSGGSNHRDIYKSTSWMKFQFKREEAEQMLSNEALAKFIQLHGPADDHEEELEVMIYDRVGTNCAKM